ncbi:hypothetical protein DPMN_094720 [Dreissena polymorpha]|uniref:Uncharacterized protein n=1 Tax=Dreissena polymorpha TaxID=45954 RepID=A0A9D4L6J6_DREPO|nr:hypothetical protein DPMN_094720 [Dreissena polymorpha]
MPIGGNMMQSYMERQLGSLHDSSAPSVTSYKDNVFSFIIGTFVISILPYLHIGVVHLWMWVPDKPSITRNNCTCSCFDTVMKGEYEQPGTTGYKHVYFNATWQTLRIWIFTIVFVLLARASST